MWIKRSGCTGGAIEQIKEREYPAIVPEFTGSILLVGINYDKKTKKHECRIARWEKTQVVAQTLICVNYKHNSK